MANYIKRYITLEEFNTLQWHGIKYEGFITGVGYTYTSPFALAPEHMQANSTSPYARFGFDMFIQGDVQYIDSSPEAIARSYNVKPDDIAKKIVSINKQQGTITVNMGHKNYITLPLDKSNIKIDVIDNGAEQIVTVLAHNILTNEQNKVKTKMTDVPVVFGSGFNSFGDRIGIVNDVAQSQGGDNGGFLDLGWYDYSLFVIGRTSAGVVKGGSGAFQTSNYAIREAAIGLEISTARIDKIIGRTGQFVNFAKGVGVIGNVAGMLPSGWDMFVNGNFSSNNMTDMMINGLAFFPGGWILAPIAQSWANGIREEIRTSPDGGASAIQRLELMTGGMPGMQ